jgi:hypothetical protein
VSDVRPSPQGPHGAFAAPRQFGIVMLQLDQVQSLLHVCEPLPVSSEQPCVDIG